MKLYYAPGACSLSPHIVAREAGIELALEKVDIGTKRTESGRDFLAVNPKGYVPALELDDGEILTEGPAVVQYLADLKPESGLAPPYGTMERYRLMEALAFISSEIHKGYGPLFDPRLTAEARAERVAYMQKRFGLVERMLDGRPFLLGERFTCADAYLFVMANWKDYLKVDLSAFANVLAFHARVAARPAVQAALREEGLIG
ncbi:MAG TPA: glutathione transferase GstA [Gammaproteobacteria bacterium]